MGPAAAILPATWEIFCRVVDNFGDIGVCWRFSRMLSRERGLQVRLWIDDWQAFVRLCPAVCGAPDGVVIDGVEVRRWLAEFPAVEPAEVVIEAFACDLPETHLQAMARRSPAPVWINLEYLSAEDWIVDCHGMRSPHPRLPLVKHFFFPGFDAGSGGLLREAGLIAAREAFGADARAAHLSRLGVEPPAADTLVASLFAYTLPHADALLRAWSEGPRPMLLLVPEGRVLPDLGRHFGRETLQAGDLLRSGSLQIAVLPFSDQDGYDRLLWSCDLNFVRGEDSFVRAQWAGRPFVWQIYAQAEDAHGVKLQAFLDRYCAGLDQDAAAALAGFWRAWNRLGPDEADVAATWPAFAAALPALAAHARRWSAGQAALPDLATELVHFCAQQVKS